MTSQNPPLRENNPVTTCRLSKTLCKNRPTTATGKQFLKRAQSQGAKLENNLQNYSGASRVSSSQYNTCTVHCIVAAKDKLHSPTEWASCTIDSEKEIPDPCAQALLLTGAPGCPTESATGSRQCNSLQCCLVHGSGRLIPTPLTEQDRRARGTRQQDSQDKQTNKRIQGQANLQLIREGREEVTVACVCVMMGPAALCNP